MEAVQTMSRAYDEAKDDFVESKPALDTARPVQMRLRTETIGLIDELKRLFHSSNRTDAVVRAVRLAHSIATEVAGGGRIELHRKNGEIRELLIR